MARYSAQALCNALMKANSEEEVIHFLQDAGYWSDQSVWRPYGGRSSNFNTIGNQQSHPDAPLVEKLVNSIDARLMNECLLRGIDPEGRDAPQSMREAVARFFENGSMSSAAGLIREWTNSKRTEVGKGITLAATGYRANQGNPCFIISDCGEGQTPDSFPNTLLSLDKENKVKIPFVQGKFNMGGSGVLEFCGKRNLELVVSRRNPKLLKALTRERDAQWGFTVVRREDPVGGRKSSVYTYLAPFGAESKPGEGAVLSFPARALLIFPEGQNPLGRESEWGTLIKLYEYSTTGFSRSNILMRDGLLRQLDLLLPDLALPIRLYECRPFGGHAGSFETNLTGIRVRLDDDKGNNLEGEPISISMQVHDEKMTGTVYVFKKDRAETYKSDEGILFAINGQTHGRLSKDFFRRKKVGMSYLADSILITIDCSSISRRAIELLFMPDRETLRDCDLKRAVENELEELVSNHPALRALRERRRREELESLLNNAKPLGDLLEDLIKDSPTLTALFLRGTHIPNPFKTLHVKESTEPEFVGRRFPTYFKFPDLSYGTALQRNCHINRRARVFFETDAENSYFRRDINPGSFRLYTVMGGKRVDVNHVINLWNGIATLNIPLPEAAMPGDVLELTAVANDETRIEPFKNVIKLTILDEDTLRKSKPSDRKKPPTEDKGEDREKPTGIQLPNIVEVAKNPGEHQKAWDSMKPAFDEYSALRIIHAGTEETVEGMDEETKDIYDFFVNVDNIYLKTEQKSSKEEPDVLQAKFKYGLVLIGLALINSEQEQAGGVSSPQVQIEKLVERISKAVASVLVPMINELGALELEAALQ